MSDGGEDRPLEDLSKAELIAEVRRLRAAPPGGDGGRAAAAVVDAAAAASVAGTCAAAPADVTALDEPALLRAIVDAAPVIITVKDRDGRYVYANRAAAEWFDCRPEDMVGRTAFDILPAVLAEEVAANDARVFGDGKPLPFYEAVLIRDGGERLVRTAKVPLEASDGAVALALNVSVDVTELRENEARLRALVDTAPFPLYFKDRDARFTLANEKYLQLYGVTLSDVLGCNSLEIYPGSRGEEYYAEDRHVLDTGQVFEREIELGGLPHIVVKFPVVDAQGRLLGLGGIESDVSRLKEMQVALQLAKETAELANRSKTEFLANMSHELRTPLNSVIGFAQLIRESRIPDPTGRRARDYATDIMRSGEHLLELIGDILDVSRIEIGTLPVEDSEVDLAALIEEGVRMLEVRAPAEVRLRAEPHAERIPVRADERRLRQILINLLSNAVKFTPAGEVRITTEIADDGCLRITVRDTGIGIPTQDLAHVLAPFSRSGSASIRSREGAGLGLWLAKELTELHGGHLTLESREGQGTIVTILLPPERVLRA